MKAKAFTAKIDGIANVLLSPIVVFNEANQNNVQINGIWDTGATGSTITTNVVKALGLSPTGMTMVHTANGVAQQNTYTVNIGLPNRVMIERITVTEVPGLSGGCDALIGMSIINLGDFSVTNHNGKTCFSFRIPSLHEVDYVKSPEFGEVKVSKSHAQSLEEKLREKRLNAMKNKK